MLTEQWAAAFTEMALAWERLQATNIPAWEQQFAAMRTEQERLVRLGRWTSGPTDLLTIAGVHRRELAHSAVLAWLCDPYGSHGSGPAFLKRLLQATGEFPDVLTDAETSTEVQGEHSRADVVVEGNGWRLVAELKIDAGEMPDQCQRVYDDWQADPGT